MRHTFPLLTLTTLALAGFMAPASAEARPAPQVSESAPVLFRGIFGAKDGMIFSLQATDATRAVWVAVGETQAGIKVTAYDKNRRVLSLVYKGKSCDIRLANEDREGWPNKPVPKFARAGQVTIKGWENLTKLSPERRRRALEKINALLGEFDKSVGPISKKRMIQAEEYDAEEAKDAKNTAQDPDMIEASRDAEKEESQVRAGDMLDEKDLPERAKAEPAMPEEKTADATPKTSPSENPANEPEGDGLSENQGLWKQTLSIEVTDAPGGSASVIIDNWTDTGGAHGNSNISVMNFIGDSQTPASLADLLANTDANGPALSRLSRLSEASFKKTGYKPDLSWDGLAPTPENFANLALTPYGLRVIFQPYQVGSYANGNARAYLPAASLNGVVSPKVRALWGK